VKKLLSIIVGLSTISFISPVVALAGNPLNGGTVDPCTGANSLGGIGNVICSLSTTSIGSTVQKIVIFIVIIAVVIALLYLLYGGIKWITSRGDKTEVEAARNHITAAIVGLIIVFLAIFIIAVVLALFGITTNQLNLPHF
jgi:hypothetical protein